MVHARWSTSLRWRTYVQKVVSDNCGPRKVNTSLLQRTCMRNVVSFLYRIVLVHARWSSSLRLRTLMPEIMPKRSFLIIVVHARWSSSLRLRTYVRNVSVVVVVVFLFRSATTISLKTADVAFYKYHNKKWPLIKVIMYTTITDVIV